AIIEQAYIPFNPGSGQGVTLAAGPTDFIRGAEIYVNLVGTTTIRAFDGATGFLIGEQTAFPNLYSRVLNMVVGNFRPGGFDPRDNDSFFTGFSFDFNTQDLAVVAGDGPIFQRPRFFIGSPFSPAPFNGP